MKNKKLFAILTLVCFMFTLMPMAAFAAEPTYAEVDSESEIVVLRNGSADVQLNVTNATTGSYYVYAENNGVFNKVFGFQEINVATGQGVTDSDNVTFTRPGSYDLFVVVADADVVALPDLTNAEKVALLKDKSSVVMLANAVTVKAAPGATYDVNVIVGGDVVAADIDANGDAEIDLLANSGYDTKEVWVKLTNGGSPVVGAELAISTNSYAIDVDKTTVKTNAAGIAKFEISASVAGDFEVYVEYGSKADATITVDANGLTASNITTVAEPKAPVALGTDMVYGHEAGIYFAVKDANGNAVAPGVAGVDYKVTVVKKPAGAVIDGDIMSLARTNNGWGLVGETFNEEGVYTFKVTLANGNYATASVTVKEFAEPVALKVVYPTNAVELGGQITAQKVIFVDANGVTRDARAGEVTLSATGYAIDKFEGNNMGKLTVKADEKYVGSVVKVLAVSEKFNLVSTVELTVAKEAASVAYATKTADVAVNNTLVANIVDEDGNKVAMTGTLVADGTDIQYIVVDKPANSKVAIYTVAGSTDLTKGEFKVSFTASTAGEYKIQTVVRTTVVNGTEKVTKYYSGIETITVGSTGIKDVVVMSIGSDQIIINNTVEKMLCEAVIKDGRTMVPFRAGLEALGATVDYVAETQSVIAEMNGTKVVMTIGEKVYTVNGVAKTADVAPYLNAEASTTMVPASFVAKAFGINVNYTTNPDGTVADVLFAN